MLEKTVKRIGALDQAAMGQARSRQESLALPFWSLGRLHDMGIQLAGITGQARPRIQKLAVVTMAGDHGVAAQGVSLFPQAVTREMVANFARGGAAINVLSRHVGARLIVVDMGVAGPPLEITLNNNHAVRFADRRVAAGTADISRGPAMTREQAVAALEAGIAIFEEEKALGLDAVGTGDMGIANTTPSSAIAAALLQREVSSVVNRGTGVDDDGLRNKIKVVEKILEVNKPDPNDPLDTLAKVGGFEIGGIAGVILGACASRTPVVIDGFISTAAAMLASLFDPNVKNYLFAGHQSAVEGHRLMLESLRLQPMIDLGMRLGEGTGAAFGLSIIAAASRIGDEMLTFDEAQVSKSDAEGGSC